MQGLFSLMAARLGIEGDLINVKAENDGSFVYSFSAEMTEEFSTRRTMLAAVNTRKGANGELFIDSIPDSEKKAILPTKNLLTAGPLSRRMGKIPPNGQPSPLM